jgi:predicted dehydrogenase
VVGLGNAGFDLHVPALLGLPGIETIAVDTDAARRDRAAARYKVRVEASLDAALAGPAPAEVVVVATPPESHLAISRRAFAAGAHVFCEKPMATSVREAQTIIDEAAKAGRRLAVNHEFREMPIFRALLDQVGKPDNGRMVFAQAWQNMDLPPWMEPGWRGKLLTGTLYEAGLHLVDYCLALFGEKPKAVTATVSTCGVREEASDAVALVTLEFSRGRLAQVVQNRLSHGETQYFEVRADAEKASLRASFGGRARISAGLFRSTTPHLRFEVGASGMAWREVGHNRMTFAKNPKDPAMAATRIMAQKTFAAFAGGGKPPATGEDGRDALEVLAGCYLSAAGGRRVVLDGSEDLRSFRFGSA